MSKEWSLGFELSVRQSSVIRPSLSVLALISFLASFTVARTFTTLSPSAVFIAGSIHIHHFWYGIAMLALGGWLGINYNDLRITRFAAIMFGAGGGLIGDEVGLLLTLESANYWAGVTFTFVIIFTGVASILILVNIYRTVIRREFSEFLGSSASFYFGVLLAAISIGFVLETGDFIINIASTISTVVGVIIALSYFIQRLRKKTPIAA